MKTERTGWLSVPDRVALQPCAVILKPQLCPWLPRSLLTRPRAVQSQLLLLTLKCRLMLQRPQWPRWLDFMRSGLQSHFTGVYLASVDTRGRTNGVSVVWDWGWAGSALYRTGTWPPFRILTIYLNSLTMSKAHNLIRTIHSSRKKSLYFYFKIL